ncbi:hypothetical protein G5714_015515 [Onychostoma macrolepis]|uniref:Uncharacterized protein n=1 Tax=Onychostoma macrolepis TaxID=369639 RepID=A0A7J6CB43_9TELE|nr:hypothetical protein G5714_015515 [Onychostoma macrolepis]
MDRRVLVLFCLLTAVRSDNSKPEIKVNKNKLECATGVFDKEPASLEEYGFYTYTCTSNKKEDCPEADHCAKQKITVKILNSENLIQLDSMLSLASVVFSNILVTTLIGWAVYTICAQPPTRSSYQGNKASDRQALINNHTPSGGDTYQRLNTRTDEYSTLHAQRKNKNKQSV